MNFWVSGDYRYAFRKGDKGSDVGALQLNLDGVTVDGIYGKQTQLAVLNWQIAHGLLQDGIAGLATQQSLIVHLQRPFSKDYDLPPGLLKSIAANESGFAIAAAGRHLNDPGWDVGAFCRSSGSTDPGQDFLRSAYNVTESARWTANHAVESRDALPAKPVSSRYFTELAGNKTNQFRWQLAILAHNWPVAAHNIAQIGTAMKTPGADDQPAEWIVAATNGRLRTPREWCLSYIARATVYVRWT